MTRDAITVTTAELERFAFEYGREITMRPDHAELRIGSRLFVAPLPLVIPQQRGPLNTPPVPAPRKNGGVR